MLATLSSEFEASPPTLTLACCVEAGPLEEQTIRLAESWRQNAGRFSSAPIWAITPRRGLRLRRETLARFETLSVEHRHVCPPNRYSWNHFLNKAISLAEVEKHCQTTHLAFIDSDVLCLAEPTELTRKQFTACVHSFKQVASTGPHDDREKFWTAICAVFGLAPDDLPFVQTPLDNQHIRLYFNAGIFCFETATGFGSRWLRDCNRALDARIGVSDSKSHVIDQVVLGLSLVQSGLDWKELPYSHNYDISSWMKKRDYAQVKTARLLHYHDSMENHFWPQLLETLEHHPETRHWLEPLGPIQESASTSKNYLAKLLKTNRVLRRNFYNSRLELL